MYTRTVSGVDYVSNIIYTAGALSATIDASDNWRNWAQPWGKYKGELFDCQKETSDWAKSNSAMIRKLTPIRAFHNKNYFTFHTSRSAGATTIPADKDQGDYHVMS